jgi:hypothetical protein
MKIIDQPSLADLVAIDAEARSVAHALTAPLPH